MVLNPTKKSVDTVFTTEAFINADVCITTSCCCLGYGASAGGYANGGAKANKPGKKCDENPTCYASVTGINLLHWNMIFDTGIGFGFHYND